MAIAVVFPHCYFLNDGMVWFFRRGKKIDPEKYYDLYD
jgi:hypothetical protein